MIDTYSKCCNKYIIQNKIENCDELTQIKQNKRKLIYSQAHVNGTDHHISGSCCDLISPARRTIKCNRWLSFFKIIFSACKLLIKTSWCICLLVRHIKSVSHRRWALHKWSINQFLMMTSSNTNIFRDRWIPLRKASDVELWCFDLRLNKRLSKQSCG